MAGLALADFPDDVGRLVLRLVVRPRLHLREQPERHELNAGEDQQDAEEQNRPIGDSLQRRQADVDEPREDQRRRASPMSRPHSPKICTGRVR